MDFEVKLFTRRSLVLCFLKILQSRPLVLIRSCENNCFESASTIAFITLDMTIILPHLRIICRFQFAYISSNTITILNIYLPWHLKIGDLHNLVERLLQFIIGRFLDHMV